MEYVNWLKAFLTSQIYITFCCFSLSRGQVQEDEDGGDEGGHGGHGGHGGDGGHGGHGDDTASWQHPLHAHPAT